MGTSVSSFMVPTRVWFFFVEIYHLYRVVTARRLDFVELMRTVGNLVSMLQVSTDPITRCKIEAIKYLSFRASFSLCSRTLCLPLRSGCSSGILARFRYDH